MPRGGRHAGGAYTAPNGIQGQPRNSPDYCFFGNCGVTTVVHSLWTAPPLVRIGVWIGNIRIAVSKSDVALWEAQVLRNADGFTLRWEKIANPAARSTPSWGCILIMLTGRYP
ncbi:target of rapamycin (TOR) kinase 1 [Trypanosoma cruzi]|nr:target of rapamycin (TOR) kinase 1 [Trypanosoma cruzi]